VTVTVLAFFVEGGEYGTSDLWRQRGEREALAAEVEMLRDSVIVMQATVKAAQSDTVLLERLAREQWGMVRPGEILYWVRDPGVEDSLTRDSTEADGVDGASGTR
jgi:cell division protein FtsB